MPPTYEEATGGTDTRLVDRLEALHYISTLQNEVSVMEVDILKLEEKVQHLERENKDYLDQYLDLQIQFETLSLSKAKQDEEIIKLRKQNERTADQASVINANAETMMRVIKGYQEHAVEEYTNSESMLNVIRKLELRVTKLVEKQSQLKKQIPCKTKDCKGCEFLHEDEVKPKKSKICFFFAHPGKNCIHGDNCKFSHDLGTTGDDEEVKTDEAKPASNERGRPRNVGGGAGGSSKSIGSIDVIDVSKVLKDRSKSKSRRSKSRSLKRLQSGYKRNKSNARAESQDDAKDNRDVDEGAIGDIKDIEDSNAKNDSKAIKKKGNFWGQSKKGAKIGPTLAPNQNQKRKDHQVVESAMVKKEEEEVARKEVERSEDALAKRRKEIIARQKEILKRYQKKKEGNSSESEA